MTFGAKPFRAMLIVVSVSSLLIAACSSGGGSSRGDEPFKATADAACSAAANEKGTLSYVASTDAAVFGKEIEPFRAKHPDIDIRYNKVRLVLSTHSKGGLTDLDFALAERIDTLSE